MKYLYIDVETRSKTDIKTAGAWRYSEDPEADCICIAWAIDGSPVSCMSPDKASHVFVQDPGDDVLFVARNAQFEYAIFCNILIPRYGFNPAYADPTRWVCTAALSRMHGLPASLEASADYLNKRFKKLPDGKRLISLYCIPATDRKTGEKRYRPIPPDDWEKMLEYNKIDVESDREAYGVLSRLPNDAIERPYFLHDLAMNARGLRIDTAALDKLLLVFDAATDDVNSAQRKLTSLVTDKNGKTVEKPLNVRSPKNLQAWLEARGVVIDDCKVDTIEAAYDDADAAGNEEIKKVLAWRLFLGKASVKKFKAAKDRVSPDGRLRYFLRYHGAHTGRASGEGFQVHNLPKAKWEKGVNPCQEIDRLIKTITPSMPYKELIDAGKKILPGLIIPDDGNVFIAGDFAAVEARGIAYLAGCETLLARFASGADIYTELATRINPAKPNRQLGKAAILGCGYGLGIKKFKDICVKWGIDVPPQVAENAVTTYRTTYPEIPAFWYSLEEAFRACLLSRTPQRVGRIKFERGGNYIRVGLPSGRWLFYHQPQLKDGELSYMNFGKKGARVKIWGGVLAENITQAFCRDILLDRVLTLEKRGLPVVFHVHDEIISEVSAKKAPEKQKVFDLILNTAPDWCKGFPLKTESEVNSRYRK